MLHVIDQTLPIGIVTVYLAIALRQSVDSTRHPRVVGHVTCILAILKRNLLKRHGDIGTDTAPIKKRLNHRHKTLGMVGTILTRVTDGLSCLCGKDVMNGRGFAVGNGVANHNKMLGGIRHKISSVNKKVLGRVINDHGQALSGLKRAKSWQTSSTML